MEVLRDGTFSEMISAELLARGLRPTNRMPRNKDYLVDCVGAVGIDDVLQVIDDLDNDRIDTSVIADGHPYPQIFVFNRVIIVCGEQVIYEYASGVLTLVHTASLAGTLWSAVDFYEFIYMSNNVVALLRDPTAKTWSETTDQPIANAICNFNGQVFTGGPSND